MTPKVVYDTNVVVSATLKPGSIPASLVALAMARQVRLFLSGAILEEYTEVFKRPEFGLDAGAVDRFLRDLRSAASEEADNRCLSAPKEPVQSIW
jgi:putative PIN family toxin of toxin-antitoxin system